MTKQKPRKFKGWHNVPTGVIVRSKGKYDDEPEFYLKPYDTRDDEIFADLGGGWVRAAFSPDFWTTKKYREVIL